MKKQIEQIDRETGEVMEGCMVYIPYRPKLKERWFMAFQDTFEELAKDREITNEPRRVLDYMFSKLDFENFIQLSQKDITEALGMHKSQVSEAIKLLSRKQIILEGPKVGRSKCYRLNPHYGWKGKVKNLETERRSHLRAIEGGLGKAQDPNPEK